MIKLEVQQATEGELKTLCTREYDSAHFVVPEPRNVVTIPEINEDDETLYIVRNVIHELAEEEPAIRLIVQAEEEMIREAREQQARMQKLQQLQQVAQQAKGQGGNPLGGKASELFKP